VKLRAAVLREMPERVGAALTKPGRASTARCCGFGQRDEGEYARNQRVGVGGDQEHLGDRVAAGQPASRVVVFNPAKARAIAEAKVKTDRVDAAILAGCWPRTTCRRCGCRTPQTTALRRQVQRRGHIVRQRTRLKNQVQATLHRNLVVRGPAEELTQIDTDLAQVALGRDDVLRLIVITRVNATVALAMGSAVDDFTRFRTRPSSTSTRQRQS
jgi:transposase